MPERRDVAVEPDLGSTRRVEAAGVFWLLLVTGVLLQTAGWLLPWFVEPIANGVGRSAQDVVSQPRADLVTLLALLVGVSLVTAIAGLLIDAVRRHGQRLGPQSPRTRVVIHLLGATATLGIFIVVDRLRRPASFGPLTTDASAEAAVWMSMAGSLISAFGLIARRWIGRHGGPAFAIVAFGFGGGVPIMFHESQDFVSWGAQSAGIYILLALGLNVVVGFAGLLDLGYAAFYAIGAYTTASFASAAHGIHLPFWVLLFLGASVAALFGAILGAPTLRLRGDYLAIVTLGFGEIVPDLARNNVLGLTGGVNGLSGVDSPAFPTRDNALLDFGQVGSNPTPYFYALLILIALVIVALRNLENSRLGRAWVAIREDEVAAAATGVNPVTTKLLAFAIGASVSGFAGAFFGAMLGSVTPETFEFAVSVTALSTVVLGGIGSITGVTVGAVVIALVIFWVLPQFREWMTTAGETLHAPVLASIDYSQYKYIVYGLILIGIMLLRPAGLLPARARRIELAAASAEESLATVREQT